MRPGTPCTQGVSGRKRQRPRTPSRGNRGAPLPGGGTCSRRAGCRPLAGPPHGGMSPARKAGRDGGRSGRLARGPGSPGTRLSAGRRRRPPPAGPCARGSAESLPPGALGTVPGRAGPGWEPPARENLCEPVGERERKQEPASTGIAGAACGGRARTHSPSSQDPHSVANSWYPGTLFPPSYRHPRPDTVSISRPALGHTQRHTKTHWLVARHPSPQTLAHCIPDAHSHTIGAHTHSIPGTHTFVVTHSFLRRENTGAHTHTGTACSGHSQSLPPHTHTHHVRAHKLPGGHTLLPRPPHTAKNYLQIPGSAPLERAGSWHFLGALAENPVCPGCLGR